MFENGLNILGGGRKCTQEEKLKHPGSAEATKIIKTANVLEWFRKCDLLMGSFEAIRS